MTPLSTFISNALSETKDVPPSDMIDIMMFKVAFKPAAQIDKEEFIKIAKSIDGEFSKVDVFDDGEHSYIELGAWIGDQRDALIFMALGTHLGIFELMTPANMMPYLSKEKQEEMAGRGMIMICLKKPMVGQANAG